MNLTVKRLGWLPLLLLMQSCGSPTAVQAAPSTPTVISMQEGRASYYGGRFHGRTTANGESFNKNALTAAHPSLPFGSKVRVTNLNNKKSVIVRINDRGPYAKGRIIDLSEQAARGINMLQSGVVRVQIERLE